MKKLLSHDEVAELLSISSTKLYQMRSEGVFGPPEIKIGRLTRFDPDDIAEWVANQKMHGEAA